MIDTTQHSKNALLVLDKDTRAFALYGMFMGWFNLMESGINDALQSSLGVEQFSGIILTRNIAFADKIRTLKCIVSLKFPSSEAVKEHHTPLNRAAKIGEIRNIVAHTPFRASENTDGIDFFAYKAASKLEYLEMDWSVQKVFDYTDQIREVGEAIDQLGTKISNFTAITQALRKTETPHSEATSNALGGLFRLGAALIEREESQASQNGGSSWT